MLGIVEALEALRDREEVSVPYILTPIFWKTQFETSAIQVLEVMIFTLFGNLSRVDKAIEKDLESVRLYGPFVKQRQLAIDKDLSKANQEVIDALPAYAGFRKIRSFRKWLEGLSKALGGSTLASTIGGRQGC